MNGGARAPLSAGSAHRLRFSRAVDRYWPGSGHPFSLLLARYVCSASPQKGVRAPLVTEIRAGIFSAGTSTATTDGEWPSPPSCAAADSGVEEGDHGPSCGPPERRISRGKGRGSMISRPLGAGMGSSAFFLVRCQAEVLPQRGMAFALLVAQVARSHQLGAASRAQARAAAIRSGGVGWLKRRA